MDEVERRLGTLTKSKKEPIEKGQKILDSYDDGQRAEVQERGSKKNEDGKGLLF